jgi:hypothetical protein
MIESNDFRAAAGLNRWPAAVADLPGDAPNGAGLFEVVRGNGERVITNVRRIAGGDRTPGSRVIAVATWLLSALGAGLLLVSFSAQFHYILNVKHENIPAIIEALSPDLAMVILSALAIGLALAGKASRAERLLIVSFAGLAAFMNYAPANPGSWRSVAAYIAPPIVLAVITDRVISVIRRHILPGDAESAWTPLGRVLVTAAKLAGLVLLYLLRTVLAPRETAMGLRRMVLSAAPVPAPPVRLVIPPAGPEVLPIGPPEVTEPAELEGASKKARLAWWYGQDPDYGNRSAAAAAAKRLAPKVDLSEGTARAYLGAILDGLEQDRRAS